jgi:hypothetical protein
MSTQTCNNRSPTSKWPQAAAGPYVFIDEIKMLVFCPNSRESIPPTIFKPNPSPEYKNIHLILGYVKFSNNSSV